jgi:phosphotransferase system HPr (HPr) family protein
LIAATAKRFSSRVIIGAKGHIVEASSILNVLSLWLKAGDRLTLVTEGPDAAQAIAELEAVLTTAAPGELTPRMGLHLRRPLHAGAPQLK